MGANCGSHTCAAGYKAKASAASITCLGASATCTTGTCCDLNPDLCGGAAAVACTFPSTHYWDSAKAGTAPGTACCTVEGTCESAYNVPSGGTGTGTTSGTSKIDPPYYGIVATLIVGFFQCL